MRWLCHFMQCRWFHVHGHVWQCFRCKSCSVGHDPEMPQ
jgi:hypothetical protein